MYKNDGWSSLTLDMKVKCIKNIDYEHHLKIGKTYDVINIDYYGNYIIINNKGNRDWYPGKWFKSLAEYRIEKINKLLRE
jgi:hypothetical protein